MRDWVVRRAKPDDAVALRQIITAAYAAYVGQIDDLPDVAEGIEADIAQNLVFVAASDGRIGGGMVLVVADDYLQLANIAVAPEFSGQGLGRQMMGFAEAEAKRLNYTEIRLSTHVLMPENVALYTHLGWREMERAGSKVLMTKTV